MQTKLKGIGAAILAMSLIQMASNAAASILPDIMNTCSGLTAQGAQYLMTFPNLMIVVMSLLTPVLADRFGKKALILTGLLMVTAAGVISYAVRTGLTVLIFGAGLMGAGVGLVIPMANSLIAEYYDKEGKSRMLGRQTAAANAGSMLMTALGGILAAVYWRMNYLVYLLAVPGILLTMRYIPGRAGEQVSKKSNSDYNKLINHERPAGTVLPVLTAFLFMLLFCVGPTNLALLLSERAADRAAGSLAAGNAVNAALAGTAVTVLLLGGTVGGLVFGAAAAQLKENVLTAGFAALAAGFCIAALSRSIPILLVGCFLAGLSNPFVLPELMRRVSCGSARQNTAAMSLLFSAANLGTFFTPVLTPLSQYVTGSADPSGRFLCAAGAAVILGTVTAIAARWSKRPGTESKR